MEPDFFAMLRCPNDAAGLQEGAAGGPACSRCGRSWPVSGGKIFFTSPPADFIAGGEAGADGEGASSRWRRENFSFFQDGIAKRSEDDVLVDIGAGISPFRGILARFKKSVGVDFYPYEGVAIVCDITGVLPFRDQCCDIVFLANVLEHVPAPLALLKEIHRMLRPGGLLIGSVPFLMELHMAPYDFLRYTHYMLDRMFRESGFRTRSVRSLGRPRHVYETMQRQFFDRLIHSDVSGSHMPRFLFRLLARLGRKSAAIHVAIFGQIFHRAARSDEYTEGYGFMAWK